MRLRASVSIGYKDIFSDFDKVDINILLLDIPTQNSLELIAHSLAQLHANERDKSLQIELLKIWVGRLPKYIHDSLNSFIDLHANFVFLNNISGLIFIEKLIEQENQLARLKEFTPDQELNVFKVYLYCSQLWLDKQLPVFLNGKIENNIDLIKAVLPSQLPFLELLEYKDFRLQFLKAVYFFKFCETNKQFLEYLNIFLKEYNLESWQIYLSNILSLYARKFEKNTTPSVINIPNEFPDIISFLGDLSIDTKQFKQSDDFLSIRNKPVYRFSKNDFIFLNLNFLVDKIYQGIQFDFSKVLVNNLAKYNGKVIKSTADFMTIFGDEFSENGLFYSVMDYAFEKSGFVKFNGQTMKGFLGGGEPDYYIRDKSKIYIFEFKNIYIGAPVKHSFDYNIIEKEIFKKLVSNEDKSPKGVTQLINTIEKIKNGDFNQFDNYDFNAVKIYPVIVYVDFTFNLGGPNYILNKEFRRLLIEKNITNTHFVKDLILINIDNFIKFQDLFRNNSLKLNNCFNEFYEYLRIPNDAFSSISTFNMFIHNKTMKMEYDTPKMLMEEVVKILPKR